MDTGQGALFLLLSTMIGIFAKKENCTTEEFIECLTALEAIAQRDDLALATTREELSHVCRKLQQGVKCVHDHSFRCFTSAQKRIFNSVVSESRVVIDDLCVPGKLQEDYLKYAPCLKNVSTDERKCAIQYRRLTGSHIEASDDDDYASVNEKLRVHCCVFTEFVQCQHEHLTRDCGIHVSQFFQSHMDRMSGSLINEHCSLFTRNSDGCTFEASSSHRLFFDGHFETKLLLFICSISSLINR